MKLVIMLHSKRYKLWTESQHSTREPGGEVFIPLKNCGNRDLGPAPGRASWGRCRVPRDPSCAQLGKEGGSVGRGRTCCML